MAGFDPVTLAMAKAYTDRQRLAYSEGEELASFQLTLNADMGMCMGVNMGSIGLEVGKTYTVTTDSGSYTAVCKELQGVLVLGNAYLTNPEGFDNTGETFCVVEMDDGAGLMTVALDANNGAHMKVSTETIHPIDPKFLPGVCLPVVELSTEFVPPEYVAVTAEESAQLEQAAATGLPIVVRATFMGMTLAEVFTCVSSPDSPVPVYSRTMSLSGSNFQFLILNDGEGWQIQLEEV